MRLIGNRQHFSVGFKAANSSKLVLKKLEGTNKLVFGLENPPICDKFEISIVFVIKSNKSFDNQLSLFKKIYITKCFNPQLGPLQVPITNTIRRITLGINFFNMICSIILTGVACTSALRNHMALVQRVLESHAEGDEKTWNKVRYFFPIF